MSHPAGSLYVVATPIGNLEDLSPRAQRILAEADLIAAEDTRHTGRLLQHFAIATPMRSLHQHNEATETRELLERLRRGESIALVSDAGTPLLSDPGFELVRGARAAGFPVHAIAGPSALVAALSVAGLPADRFVFEGFLPMKSAARRKVLESFVRESRTVVCFESSHRIEETLDDCAAVFDTERRIGIARELTKIHEEVRTGTIAELRDWLAADAHRKLGEFVLMIAGVRQNDDPDQVTVSVDNLLKALLGAMSVSEVARVAAQLSGLKKNALYERALQLQKKE